MQVPVNTKQELLQRLRSSQNEINSFGVKQIGIFGSFVRNQVSETSDVDFFIEFYPHKKSFDNFMDLAFFLEDLVGRKVELVTPQSLSKYIGPHILKEVEYVSFAA
ncbi:MAG TPA: nucleotidyltransferase family protein [Bacteroidia bacterium]|nr:nucleotidyltransferase family protein [Bacteroidia bacterium]